MSIVHCPRCGKPTFTVRGWAAVDRCPRCGSHLSEGEHLSRTDPRALELEVRERLYGGRQGGPAGGKRPR